MIPVRIAMWSGPRNISTALMRSFGNRPDCTVVDEPFYAAFLSETGLQHPMREEVLQSQPTDWRIVARELATTQSPLTYEKHMAHHMLPDMGLDWIQGCRNAFLIRDPVEVLASYVVKRADVTLADIGIVQQRAIFEREADRLGRAPPVLCGADVAVDPRNTLIRLCKALKIPFLEQMLSWPAGPRAHDGVWAPAWYDTVWRSTGFSAPERTAYPPLPDPLRRIADAARPHYEALFAHHL